MTSPFSAIALIAENKIQEAIRNGELDNLPGQGKPLRFEDMSNVPQDLRMAYKILKNAGCLPPELAMRKEIGKLSDLLDACPSEREKARAMAKLRFLLRKVAVSRSRLACSWDDEYYARVLERLARHEKSGKG